MRSMQLSRYRTYASNKNTHLIALHYTTHYTIYYTTLHYTSISNVHAPRSLHLYTPSAAQLNRIQSVSNVYMVLVGRC